MLVAQMLVEFLFYIKVLFFAEFHQNLVVVEKLGEILSVRDIEGALQRIILQALGCAENACAELDQISVVLEKGEVVADCQLVPHEEHHQEKELQNFGRYHKFKVNRDVFGGTVLVDALIQDKVGVSGHPAIRHH